MPICEEVRWIIMKKRRLDGYSFESIREALSAGGDPGPSDSTIRRVLNRFDQTGEVAPRQGQRAGPAPNQKFGQCQTDMALIKALLDSPGDMLTEIRKKSPARWACGRTFRPSAKRCCGSASRSSRCVAAAHHRLCRFHPTHKPSPQPTYALCCAAPRLLEEPQPAQGGPVLYDHSI